MNIVTIPDFTPEPTREGWPHDFDGQANQVRNMLHKVLRSWADSVDGVEVQVNWNRIDPTICTLTRPNLGLTHTERNLDGSAISPPRADFQWFSAYLADLRQFYGITPNTPPTSIPDDSRTAFRKAAKNIFDNM